MFPAVHLIFIFSTYIQNSVVVVKLDRLLKLPQGPKSIAQVAVRSTFASPGSHFLCDHKVLVVILHRLLKLAQGTKSNAQVAVRSTFPSSVS